MLPRVDEEATQRRLQELLLNKNAGEDPLADTAPDAALGGGGASAGVSRAGSKAAQQRLMPSASSDHGGAAAVGTAPAPSEQGSLQGGPAASSNASASAAAAAAMALSVQQAREFEEEKRQFVEGICSERTRPDVQAWVGKIFAMSHNARLAAQQAEAKERRRRRMRARSCSATSDAGLSGFSGNTGQTAETGQSGTSGTALLTAGGSIATTSYKAPKSVASEESLVVNFNAGDEPLSMKERIQAYIDRRCPELETHVNEHVAKKSEELQRELDGELADEFLLQTAQRKVFDGRANYLRWQNMRHQVLQKRLDTELPQWTLEAIQAWDQKKSMENQEKEISDTDLIFEYLTKRAAHIDTGKLPTEIPRFRTLHASYSLPSMWRDRL